MVTIDELQDALRYELEQMEQFHHALLVGRYDGMSAAGWRAMVRIRVGDLCAARIALQQAQIGEKVAA